VGDPRRNGDIMAQELELDRIIIALGKRSGPRGDIALGKWWGGGFWQTGRNTARRGQSFFALASTHWTCSSSNTWVESSRRVLAAPIPLLALIARSWFVSRCNLSLWSNALNLAVATKDARKSNRSVRRSGWGSIHIQASDINL